MNFRFAQGTTHYTLDGAERRIPPHWNLFGLPVHRFKGESGYMGKTRIWALGDTRKLKLTLWWPLQVLHEAGL